MHTDKSSYVKNAFEKIGRALELARTASDLEERSYFLGSADALIDFINLVENTQTPLTRADVQEAFNALEFSERVESIFASNCGENHDRSFVRTIARYFRRAHTD